MASQLRGTREPRSSSTRDRIGIVWPDECRNHPSSSSSGRSTEWIRVWFSSIVALVENPRDSIPSAAVRLAKVGKRPTFAQVRPTRSTLLPGRVVPTPDAYPIPPQLVTLPGLDSQRPAEEAECHLDRPNFGILPPYPRENPGKRPVVRMPKVCVTSWHSDPPRS
jgi:hypothetical protein